VEVFDTNFTNSHEFNSKEIIRVNLCDSCQKNLPSAVSSGFHTSLVCFAGKKLCASAVKKHLRFLRLLLFKFGLNVLHLCGWKICVQPRSSAVKTLSTPPLSWRDDC